MSKRLEKVNWRSWSDEAFDEAKKNNKAIFISISYSSCHWCKEMDKQVFQNQECVDILNAGFICIKVDREERPDIDKYYQKVYQLLNNRVGGWPTSIFCTPQNKAFFARTYMDVESVEGSNEGMGFKELANIITTKVSQNDEQLFKNADEVANFLEKIEHPKEATVLNDSFIKNFMLQAKNNYDTKNAGFSLKPKFPQSSTLKTLLTLDKLYGEKAAKEMFISTLDAMKKGGMYDLVDGGFCRYSLDNEWFAPHFEKTLYDNALLCGIYTESYLAYKDISHLQTAKECADFWHNFMSEDGLFYSASDSENEAYFIYSYEEVHSALLEAGYDNRQSMCAQMSLTPEGNFQGKNIIRFEGEIPQWYNDVKLLLSKIRASREYPTIDIKVQTSWSSMMITSLFKLGEIDENYKYRAIKNLDSLLKVMFLDGKLYHTTYIHKTPKVEAFLEDYAFVSQALLSAFKATEEELYLINAQRFVNKALEEFYDKGMWNFSSGEYATKAEVSDNTYTSAVSIMVENLLSIAMLLKDEKYKHFAFKTLEYNSFELGRRPIYMPHMLAQMLKYLREDNIYNMKNS